MVVYSCKKQKSEPVPVVPCDNATMTWSLKVNSIITTNCATSGCHVPGGRGNGDFTSYSGVKSKVDNGSMMDRVVVKKDMPQGGLLPDYERRVIECWISSGAPQN